MNILNREFLEQNPKLKLIFIGISAAFMLYCSGYIVGQAFWYFIN